MRKLAHEAVPDVKWGAAPSHDEIVFYREQSHRGSSALKLFGPLGQEAYQRLSALEHATPHARVDIADWQGVSFAAARGLGVLWAPKVAKDGSSRRYWRALEDARMGDLGPAHDTLRKL